MSFNATCPSCETTQRVPGESRGKKVSCPECGERYVARLWEAGVAGSCTRVIGHFHGGWMIPISASYRLVNDLRASALRRAFAGDLVP